MKNLLKSSFPKSAAAYALLLMATSITAGASDFYHRRDSTPVGFDHALLYMGTGLFDPNDPAPRPGLTNCSGLFCDGEYFQKTIMRRTDTEIIQIEQDAKEFFLQRFGIDVDDPVNAGRVGMEMFTVNPDFEYRVHMSAGHISRRAGSTTPTKFGWMIRDGGFRLDILDPDGYELGGELAGFHAPGGSAMFFGNYNILVTNKRNKPIDELIIHYKSKFPAGFIDNGSFIFVCDMFHEEWGEGVGFGNIRFIEQDDGQTRGNGRNVLTFPPSSNFDSWPKYPKIDSQPRPRWWR